MLEAVVSMSLLGSVLLIFTSSLVQMYRSTAKTEALSGAQTQLHVAFQRLDKQVRYASAIGAPWVDAGTWYVKFFHSTNTGKKDCVELQLGNHLLQQRTWTAGQVPGTWITLASGVSATGQPFPPVNPPSTVYQQLAVQISASVGGAREVTERTMSVKFTALNSSAGSLLPQWCILWPAS
jgi:type II secretory pathway pseudopilin PulG